MMDTVIGSGIWISVGICCLILLVVGIGVGRWYMFGKPAAEGRKLRNKFASLGNLKDRTRKEIENVLGPPNRSASVSEHQISCGWYTQKYRVTLLFDGDICQQVTTEVSK